MKLGDGPYKRLGRNEMQVMGTDLPRELRTYATAPTFMEGNGSIDTRAADGHEAIQQPQGGLSTSSLHDPSTVILNPVSNTFCGHCRASLIQFPWSKHVRLCWLNPTHRQAFGQDEWYRDVVRRLHTPPDQPTLTDVSAPVVKKPKANFAVRPNEAIDFKDSDILINDPIEDVEAEEESVVTSQASETFQGLMQSQDSNVPNVVTPSPLRPRPRRQLLVEDVQTQNIDADDPGGVVTTATTVREEVPNEEVRPKSGHHIQLPRATAPVSSGVDNDCQYSCPVLLPAGTCVFFEPE